MLEDNESVARKFDDLASKVSRWFRDQFGVPETGDDASHPGRVFHRRNKRPKRVVREYAGGPVFKGNPHLGSWKRYTSHLFDLMLDGHGGSPAAMQVRDRLNLHWKYLSSTERRECLEYYLEAKQGFENEKSERRLKTSTYERDLAYTQSVKDEVDRFMNPKTH